MQVSLNTLIYFKSKSFFYLVRGLSSIFFFLRLDFKITGNIVQVFYFIPKIATIESGLYMAFFERDSC